jgi:hypothetical protein
MNSIPTFVINLKNRTDRKAHILSEFSGRDEFKVTIIEPQKDEKPTISLWKTIKYIIENLVGVKDDFFLLCEDDHQFTEYYQKEKFLKCIKQANKMEADILSGGVSSIFDFVQAEPDLFWMDTFTGTQFVVIYRPFFKTITTSAFTDKDTADMKISSLTENKFLIYPFISVQKDFGYSDATPRNNNHNRPEVDVFFHRAFHTVKLVNDVSIFYKQLVRKIASIADGMSYENFYIPTYIINLPERTDRLAHIKKEFEGKSEFDVKLIEAIKHEKGNLGLWLTIRKIVEKAIIDEDDIIIICEDDHEFTDHYSKATFVKNVIEAHLLGAGILLGGISRYSNATSVTNELFWIDKSFCTQFTVIYKTFFKRILEEPFDDSTHADIAFSEMTSNKLVSFPYISTQKFLGDSNITPGIFKEGEVDKMFKSSQARLSKLMEATKRYTYNPLIGTEV